MALSTIRVANNCITRARNILDASTNPAIAKGTREDLRRMALVMSVVALDAYCHWTVFLKLGSVRGEAELPKGLRQLEIPFGDLALIAENAVSARRQQVHSRPWVQVKNAAQKQLLRKTMQSTNEVAQALSMIGVSNIWTKVSPRLHISVKDSTARLDSIVARRNQIAHEGDIPRQQRPRKLSHNSILRLSVSADIDFMESLIDALHAEINKPS
jgi:hypothetical protein